MVIIMTPETVFKQTCISLPQAYSMLNINLFRPVVHEKKIYQNFPYFAPYWAPKGTSPFIWTTLNPHPPSMFLVKFGWNCPSGSWEEDFLSISILLCKSLSPWGGAMHNPRDFIWSSISLPQGCSMLNINAFRPVVHEKKIFLRFLLYKPKKLCPLRECPLLTPGTLF